MSKTLKTVLSWAIALIVAYLVFKVIWYLVLGAFSFIFNLVLIIPVLIIAIPIYFIVKKKIFK